jgi:hypothetical protein
VFADVVFGIAGATAPAKEGSGSRDSAVDRVVGRVAVDCPCEQVVLGQLGRVKPSGVAEELVQGVAQVVACLRAWVASRELGDDVGQLVLVPVEQDDGWVGLFDRTD